MKKYFYLMILLIGAVLIFSNAPGILQKAQAQTSQCGPIYQGCPFFVEVEFCEFRACQYCDKESGYCCHFLAGHCIQDETVRVYTRYCDEFCVVY